MTPRTKVAVALIVGMTTIAAATLAGLVWIALQVQDD